MSRLAYDHKHQYRAVTKARNMYKCEVPKCPHTIPALTIVGREAECPECHAEIVVTKEHLRRIMITCVGCGRSGFTEKRIRDKHLVKMTGQSAKDILGKFASKDAPN